MSESADDWSPWRVIARGMEVDITHMRGYMSPEGAMQHVVHGLEQAYQGNPPANIGELRQQARSSGTYHISQETLETFCRAMKSLIDDAAAKGLTTKAALFEGCIYPNKRADGEGKDGALSR